MKRNYLVKKDRMRRIKFDRYEERRELLKGLRRSETLSLAERAFLSLKITAFPKDSSITRIRNRCTISGRGRGVYSYFRLSRMQLREMANAGNLVGVRKASW